MKYKIHIFTIAISAILLSAVPFAAAAQALKKPVRPKVQTAKVVVSGMDFLPGSLSLKRGIPAKITFQRMTEDTCGTEILIPDYGINRALPLFEKVVVSFTPKRAGEIAFSCGMNMMRGKVVVR